MADLQARLAAACADAGVPGAALSVRCGAFAEDAWWGVADVSSGRPVTAATEFRIASVTKLFTAAVLVRAVQAGHVSLDDPLDRWFAGPGITLRQLADHSSGLLGDCFAEPDDGPGALASLAGAVLGEARLHQPGHLSSYCNAGFTVLGAALEAATGAPWEELVGDLAPTLRAAPADDPHVAVLHGTGWPFDRTMAPAGSTLVATGPGLVDAIAGLTAPELAVMREPSSAFPQPSVCQQVGLGWWIDDRGGRRVLSHSGGPSVKAVWVPDADLRIALLTNGAGLRSLEEGLVQELLEELADVPPPQPLTPGGCAPDIEPGVFRHGAFSTITLSGGSLTVEPQGIALALQPLSGTAWLVDVAGSAVPVSLAQDADGTDLVCFGGRVHRRVSGARPAAAGPGTRRARARRRG